MNFDHIYCDLSLFYRTHVNSHNNIIVCMQHKYHIRHLIFRIVSAVETKSLKCTIIFVLIIDKKNILFKIIKTNQ